MKLIPCSPRINWKKLLSVLAVLSIRKQSRAAAGLPGGEGERGGGRTLKQTQRPSQKAAKARIHYPPGDVFIANVSHRRGRAVGMGACCPSGPAQWQLSDRLPHTTLQQLGAAPVLFWGMPFAQTILFLIGEALPESCRFPLWCLLTLCPLERAILPHGEQKLGSVPDWPLTHRQESQESLSRPCPDWKVKESEPFPTFSCAPSSMPAQTAFIPFSVGQPHGTQCLPIWSCQLAAWSLVTPPASQSAHSHPSWHPNLTASPCSSCPPPALTQNK